MAQSFWNSFLDNIAKPAAKTFTGGVGYWKDLITGSIAPGQAVSTIGIDAGVDIGVTKQLAMQNIDENAQQIIKDNLKYSAKDKAVSSDIALKMAVKAHDDLISPYITRPISTLALLYDFDSPLYQPGKFEKGFQFSDLKEAYNRSAEVSLGQALTKSDLTIIKPIANLAFKAGKIDLDQVDLWNDDDIQKTFVDNPIGQYFTGGIDFAVSNVAISGVFGVAARFGRLGAAKVGLTTRINNLGKVEKNIDDNILFEQSAGNNGRQTTVGSDVIKLSKTTNPDEVQSIVSKYTTNENLFGFIQKATDPTTIRDILLADKGYSPALQRLAQKIPDDLYAMGDMNSVLKAKRIETGKPLEFDDATWQKLNSAFDAAINRVPEYRILRDSLLDPETKMPLAFGKDYVPMEPVLGKTTFIKTRSRFQDLKSATITRDYTKLGGIERRILGSSINGPITEIIRFVGTEKPLYFVSYSGTRPLDGVKELDAVFDDIKLLTNGTNKIKITPTQEITAGEFRSQIKSKFLDAKSSVQRDEVLDQLEDQLSLIIAYTKGFTDTAAIKAFTQDIKAQIFSGTNQLAKKGYAMDSQARRVLTDPETQRQLAESRRLVPWGFVERELDKALTKNEKLFKGKGKSAYDVSKFFYETFNKYWSLDVLGRPSYIYKNSLFEPILSATLAHGTKFLTENIPNMTKDAILNNKNRISGFLFKKLKANEYNAVNKAVNDLYDQYNEASAILDQLNSEYALFVEPEKYKVKLSPQAKIDNLAKIKKDLKAASKLVDDIELELRDAIRPYGQPTEIPSIALLERRIQWLENQPTGGKYAGDIANAKAAIVQAKGSINTLAPSAKEMIAANKEIEAQYKAIDEILDKLGPAEKNKANLYKKDEKYKERYYSKKKRYIFVQGHYVPLDSMFEGKFGASYLEEFSNSRTVSATYLGQVGVGARQGLITRRSPMGITYVNSPHYFDELAFYVNRSFRGDPLIDRILQNQTEQEIMNWASKEGVSYFKQFNDASPSQIVDTVRDRVSLVKRYLPNAEARNLVYSKDVTRAELADVLSKDIKRLTPIHPLEMDVYGASEYGYRTFGQLEKTLNNITSWIWGKLTSPENRIRLDSAEMFYRDAVARRVNQAVEQGFSFLNKDGTINFDKLNSFKRAAVRDAYDANQNTFYSINRQSRALYASRVAFSFPTASLNSFYRYSKFTLKNPERVANFLNNYQAMFRSFGVDKYGNPTDDPRESTHIVVPLTKELGFFNGKGIRLSARGIGFILNFPTTSVFGSVAVGSVQAWKPSTEEFMKQFLGPNYEMFFPYGPQTGVLPALTPQWARDFGKWLTGPEGNKDFLNSFNDVHNYYMALDEAGIMPYPGMDKVRQATRDNFLVKAGWNFNSFFGVPAKVDTNPMAIYEEAYGLLLNKYKLETTNASELKRAELFARLNMAPVASVSNDELAAKLAGREFTSKLGVDFPIDRVTYKGSSANAFIQPNYESYKRIFEDSTGLAEKLAAQRPELVGLLTLDVDPSKEEFNLSIYNILNSPDTRLPDGSALNNLKLTPKQYEERVRVNRAWAQYNQITASLESFAKNNGTTLRKSPNLLEYRKELASTVIRKTSETWWTEFNDPNRGDVSFRYAYGLNTILQNDAWMKKYGNTKLYQDIKQFSTERNLAVDVYKSFSTNDPRKSQFKKVYLENLETRMNLWHPKLQELINRYFIEDTMKDARPGATE